MPTSNATVVRDVQHDGKDPLSFYEPRSVVQRAATVGLQASIVGAFASAVQNALASHERGAMGVFTRYGGTIGFFAAVGATFAATDAVIANIRKKDDAVNGAAAGCAAGFLAGIRARSLPMAVASCAFLGTAVGAYDNTGKIAGGQYETDTPQTWEERRRRFFKQKPTVEMTVDS